MLILGHGLFYKYVKTVVIEIDQVSAFMNVIFQWQEVGTKIEKEAQ